MKLDLDHADLRLARRRSLHLRDAAGLRIVCVSGALWITQHRDTRDVVLGAGEAITLKGSGLAVVHAARPSHLMIDETGDPPRTRVNRHALRRLLEFIVHRIKR